MRAYYGSRFSPNQTSTPEGFLICHNVPISRIGWYEYLGKEIGANDRADEIVKVFRDPDEVFNPGAMASFEGKPVTDGHPPGGVAVVPDNAQQYAKGTVQNVRRGSGDDIDLLLADLFIYDNQLIKDIQSGKREVSAGYEVSYAPNDDDTYSQRNIVGNHVAVLENGRAGDRVAIRDSVPTKEEKGMNKKVKLPNRKQSRVTDVLAAIGLKHFAQDAEPDEIVDAVDAMAEERGATDENVPDTQTPPQNTEPKTEDPALKALEAKVDQLTAVVAKLVESQVKPEPSAEDAIDAAIAQMQTPGSTEESQTIEANDEEGPISPPEERPDDPITGDSAYKIAALKAIKPVIAAISDPAERKKAADAAIASLKGKPATNTYAAINQANRQKAKDEQSTQKQPQDLSNLGREIAEKYNPHFKAKK